MYRIIKCVLLLTIFSGCSEVQTPENSFHSRIINAQLPLKLVDIDWQNQKKILQVNDGIESRIEDTVREYYKAANFLDSLQDNYYIGAIRLQADFQTIFLVVLRHYPTGYTNSKVLFYDNDMKEFIPGTFDFNLLALYDNADRKLKISNLKELFKIETPEIQLVDFNGDGFRDFQFTSLKHNGTYNAIQTTIISIKNHKIDTLSTTEKVIGSYN
ncbi:hypothetical protein [Emticicia agri]|uniref:Uncharacterized protein n=1 Tax=Emticicia agri TaxID=2492393 RepID=A0A4Q5LVP9_9BACT|nr:hypothetical protein [Emticicia agri]RYU93798.1 hypothetical protein EWM59_19950 [Emticicia agri]